MYGYKFYTGIMFHNNENDANFEDELTCHFKINLRNLRNFEPSIEKSQTFAL